MMFMRYPVVPGLLVGLCLIAIAYAGGSRTYVKQGALFRSKLLSESTVHSAASNCSAGGFPIPQVTDGLCPPKTYESFGAISSSLYPKYYANNLHCTYQLKAADEGSTVQLWFGSFATEKRFDRVNIYDGFNVNSPLLATLTGPEANISAPFNSSGQFMYVSFFTDGTRDDKGWFATFNSVRKRAPAYKCSN